MILIMKIELDAIAAGGTYSDNEDVFGKPSEIYKITRRQYIRATER